MSAVIESAGYSWRVPQAVSLGRVDADGRQIQGPVSTGLLFLSVKGGGR